MSDELLAQGTVEFRQAERDHANGRFIKDPHGRGRPTTPEGDWAMPPAAGHDRAAEVPTTKVSGTRGSRPSSLSESRAGGELPAIPARNIAPCRSKCPHGPQPQEGSGMNAAYRLGRTPIPCQLDDGHDGVHRAGLLAWHDPPLLKIGGKPYRPPSGDVVFSWERP